MLRNNPSLWNQVHHQQIPEKLYAYFCFQILEKSNQWVRDITNISPRTTTRFAKILSLQKDLCHYSVRPIVPVSTDCPVHKGQE